MTMLTTDFHTHILPGIDDGSPSVTESVKMLQQEREQGIDTVFLTPHFTASKMFPHDFLKSRQQAFVELLRETKSIDVPKLVLGAEVSFYNGMSKWEQLDQLQLGDTGYILIEMPFTKWQKSTYDELENIYFERDLIPVIAHVERYFYRHNMKKMLNILSGLPVLLQSNCSFINNWRTQRKALRLLNDQRIHLLASDCHSASWRSPCSAKTKALIVSRLNPNTTAFLSRMESVVLSGERYF